MMPASVISVENLSKRYLVGRRAYRTIDDRFPNFRDVLERSLRNTARKLADIGHGRQVVQGDTIEEFWALKDVSFEVREGEVLGIIGRNGAGKSTLFKILSRITEPTEGRITLRGRVASLLEVGTGFHPELTGRENIFLNGAILGMSRSEIRRKFDEIVAFAEIGKFLDTPVKRYSSGMYVRLAFAVAAHLEPEILIVDEVLAVGDTEFQKKCLGKMSEVAGSGRTVLFVSHNMSAVRTLCERAILLQNGSIVCDQATPATISNYLSDGAARQSVGATAGNPVNLEGWIDRTTTGEALITEIEFDDGNGGDAIVFGGNLRVRMRARFAVPLNNPIFGVVIHDATGVPVSNPESRHDGFRAGTVSDQLTVEAYLRNLNLYPGRYLLSPWIVDAAYQRCIDFPRLCLTVDVHAAPGDRAGFQLDQEWGKVFIPSQWKVDGAPRPTCPIANLSLDK